jgi:haloacetate dehalogenase
MADLADLFPGFQSHWIDAAAGRIFARSGGSGPPLVLVHGYPQSHVMWHRLAPKLAEHFQVVALDLRGYGWSDVPRADKAHTVYSKREMAKDVIAVMEALGHVHFAYMGHDRGARVGYRLALDHPGRLAKLALLDVVPTLVMWDSMDAKRAMRAYHWLFLAQPEPLPERLIGPNARFYLERTLASWTASRTLEAFDAAALAHYSAFFDDPSRIHSCCEDYRAGATTDLGCDQADRDAGKTLGCQTHVVWGETGIAATGTGALDAWHGTFAPNATGSPVKAGHFLAEENPQGTLDAVLPFLTA